MTDDDLTARMAEPDGWRSVDVELGALLRHGDSAALEMRLRAALDGRTDSVARACLAVGAGSVDVTGWEVLDAELTRAVQRGRAITAVGLDLSNYGDGAGEWWDKEPLVEVAVYGDDSYPFSTTDRDEMLAASVTYAAPWTGCMFGEEMTPLDVRGLRQLNGLLLRRQALEVEGDLVTDRIGWWWQTLRFHEAISVALSSRGLALQIPVVVGEHDAGPWVVNVVVPERVSDHLESTERLLTERAASGRASYDAHTEETVTELRELRDGCRGWGWSNRDKRRRFVDYADARVRLICSIVGSPAPRRSMAKMTDAELEQVIADYRTWRANR